MAAAQVAVAVATVVVFGTVSMFLYPLLYDLARDAGWSWMNERAYGLFAGSTIHEVAQVVAATGWPIRFADSVDTTAEPTEVELTALRDLEARTAAAHGQAPGEA